MKYARLIILSIAVALGCTHFTACSTPPSARVAQVQTLRAVGEAAKASMDATTQLLKQGTITLDKWQKVATFYDTKFQPAYTVAVYAANSDLSSVSSPDLTNLLNQLLSLASTLTAK